MKFTGERYVPTEAGRIRIEHYQRYFQALELVDDKDVLDLACGEGYGSYLMASRARSVTGVDVSHEAVLHAGATYIRQNLGFYQGSATALALADNSFDIVLSFETIEHLAEQGKMVSEMARVLRPGGILMISSPNRPVYSAESAEPNKFHVKELDFDELDGLLSRHFPAIHYYGQRMLVGSVFQPLGERVDNISLWHDEGDDFRPSLGDVNDPVYYIAVCGQGEGRLPGLNGSIFFPGAIDLYKDYAQSARRAQELELLMAHGGCAEAELARERAQRSAMEQSKSWRLTRPLRDARRWVGSALPGLKGLARKALGFMKRH